LKEAEAAERQQGAGVERTTADAGCVKAGARAENAATRSRGRVAEPRASHAATRAVVRAPGTLRVNAIANVVIIPEGCVGFGWNLGDV